MNEVTTGTAARRRSVWVLWALAVPLLALSLYRPPGGSADRARRLPGRLGAWEMAVEHGLTARHHELLGTDDAVWRTYRTSADGPPVYVVLVHHEANWKSVHPPRICLEGSNMEVLDEGFTAVRIGDATQEVGEITTRSNDTGRPYFGLYLYGAPGMRTARYAEFALHHAPRALLRLSLRGFLVRVETWVLDGEDVDDARRRCADVLAEVVLAAEEALQ